jgi:TrkA-N domain
METIWIMGAGRFGLRAARLLTAGQNNFRIVLLDRDQEKLDRARGLSCNTVCADGISYLNTHLNPGNMPTWIVPALPVHLAWEWCKNQLGQVRLLDISSKIDPLLPNPMRGSKGTIYVSHADFICPENCCEPRDICTVTKRPRKQKMTTLLSQLEFENFSSLVIQSRQLGPGVGGYTPQALFDLLEKIKVGKAPFFLSTACLCHGVITGFDR